MLELYVSNDKESVAIWHVHNYEISGNVVAPIVGKVARHSAQMKQLERAVFVTGALNFCARGPESFSDRYWRRQPLSGVKYEQPCVSHFWPRAMTCSRIDRICYSIHGWILSNLTFRTYGMDDPKRMFDARLSLLGVSALSG